MRLSRFLASRVKIERAYEHIEELTRTLTVKNRDCYRVWTSRDAAGQGWLCFVLGDHGISRLKAALLLGDVLHNLRSALDLLWYETVLDCCGTPTKYTRFPIRDTVEELEAAISNAETAKQIASTIGQLILHDVKPYKAGNYALWAIDDLNIRDKHQLLVPLLDPLFRFTGIRIEDEQGQAVNEGAVYYSDANGSIRLECTTWPVAVKQKGTASATILFDLGLPFECAPVVPSLQQLAAAVEGVVKSFAVRVET